MSTANIVGTTANVINVHSPKSNDSNSSIPNTSQPSEQVLLANFRKKLYDSTTRKTSSGVVEEYSNLREPDFEICPILLDVDFYRGDTRPEKSQYNAETNFSSNAGKWKGRVVIFDELFYRDDCRLKFRHVTLVGGAGFGKTTLLKRFARRGLAKQIHLAKPNVFTRLLTKDINIFFINVRSLPNGNEKYTPCHLLFRILIKEMTDAEAEVGYKNLMDEKEKILFVIDGLDQHEWVLEKAESIGYYDCGTVATIFRSILCGDLFPHAHVLSSSREHKIRFFEDDLKANRIIALNGLERSDIQRLAMTLPKNNQSVWPRLSKFCPNLLVMCTTPLFLIFTILVFTTKEDFACDTMTGLMTEFLECFLHSKHFNRPNFGEIIKKLKKLAYNGTMNERVIFKEADFHEIGLTCEDVQDFIIYAPKETHILTRERLKNDDFIAFFCHQSVQETLTALYIAEMNMLDFTAFVNNHLHVPHFSVVRRLICGIILSVEASNATQKLAEIGNQEEKREILMKSLESEIRKDLSSKESLELFMALFESGKEIGELVKANIHSISVARQPLTLSEANVLGYIIGHSQDVHVMELWDCKVDETKLQLILNGLRKSKIELKVQKIDMHSNYDFDFNGEILGEIVNRCHTEELDLDDCDLSDEKMDKFVNSFMTTKLKRLVVGKTDKLGERSLKVIGNIAKTNGIRYLNLNKCQLNPKKLTQFENAIDHSEIHQLDLNYNRSMGKNGLKIVGKVTDTSRVKDLNMSRCNLSSGELMCFGSNLGNAAIEILDITTHELRKTTSDEDIRALERILPHITKELRMVDWRIQEQHCHILQNKLNSLQRPDLKIIYEHIGRESLTAQFQTPVQQDA